MKTLKIKTLNRIKKRYKIHEALKSWQSCKCYVNANQNICLDEFLEYSQKSNYSSYELILLLWLISEPDFGCPDA